MTRELILDTDTLSQIKRGDIDLSAAAKADADYYIPVTQEVEFLRDFDDLDEDLRESIREVLEELDPEKILLDSGPYQQAPYGQAAYGTTTEHFDELLDKMNELKEEENNVFDILGAETAIVRDVEFVTRDGNLQEVLEDYSEEHLLPYEEYKRFVENS